MMNRNSRIILSLIALMGTMGLSACGARSGSVAVGSQAFNTSGLAMLFKGYNIASLSVIPPLSQQQNVVYGVTPTTTVQDLKICVASVKLESDDGELKENDEGQQDISFKPGLIDLTAGTMIQWGNMEVPVGFKLEELKMKASVDSAACQNVNYSVKFNEFSTTDNIEFSWKFEPAVNINDGSSLKVDLATVVGQFRQAADAGTLSNATIKTIVEATKESATEDKE